MKRGRCKIKEQYIPKQIHYCWFGGNKKSDKMKFCIASWHKYLPHYKIIEWNEENFDVNICDYVKEAYREKKYAFVSDYVRLYVLYKYGGIYMDTDVEVIKPLDDLLQFHAFCCFEDEKSISIGTLGSEKNNMWIKELLDSYKDRHFIDETGKLDMTTNVQFVTKLSTERYGLILNGEKQIIKYNVAVFTKDYFLPKDAKTHKLTLTSNSYSIHHYEGSWLSKKQKVKRFANKNLNRVLGVNNFNKLKEFFNG